MVNTEPTFILLLSIQTMVMNLPTIQHHTTPQCMICIIQSTVSTEVCMDITHIHTYSTIWKITLIASTMLIIMIIMTPTIKIWNGSDIRPSGNTIQINLTTLKKLVMLISIMMSTLTIALTILIIMMCTFIMWIQWYIMKKMSMTCFLKVVELI